jgi:RHH-type proline utilization regulon transcriptional repressor/proline dehydrogenase/delta 1-pyrroline-5-carboxylate dehydrogenase
MAMIFESPLPGPTPLRAAIANAFRADETACVKALLAGLKVTPDSRQQIAATARKLVQGVRATRVGKGGIDAFLQQYGLSTQEGVALMCIAEALLRIPDKETQERLIRDKLTSADWEKHLGKSASLFVNASTWALMLTGRVIQLGAFEGQSIGATMRRLVARLGEPVIREAVNQAMRIMGRQFVMGRAIDEALDRAKELERRDYRYSYDMLGEAARTMKDADRYFAAYKKAIAAIGIAAEGKGVIDGPGISVKLSALHPRYELTHEKRVMDELAPRLKALALDAKAVKIGLTVDAEEVDRLDISLDVIESVSGDPDLAGWNGFGIVVQAYQKRAPFVLDWLADMARRHGRLLMLRLVKGAYWDAEIKRSQERGLVDYPVFTRKVSTDVSYLACAQKLFANPDAFFPQFATHNAHTVAAVLEFTGNRRDFEFQRLHGMGEALYDLIVGEGKMSVPCRIYAPVGQHEDLLAYLVRRLLENGANSSFVNRIQDERLPIEEIIADPIMQVSGLAYIPHPRIPTPPNLYGNERRNSKGIDLFDRATLTSLAADMTRAETLTCNAGPIIAGQELVGGGRPISSPVDRRRAVGRVTDAGPEHVEQALAAAEATAPSWNARPVEQRAGCLERAADLMEARISKLMTLAVLEAGKTVPDAVAEVREAVDFCRYYAMRARHDFGREHPLRVPADARRSIRLRGRGVFVCISPWNFPLAIFTGQVVAALVAGNAVIAKPAEQTPLIAAAAVRLLHEAGVPAEVLHFLPGDGATVGGALVADPRTAGVCFTGSTDVAKIINRTLARRTSTIPPLIAETGGQNAMIMDSSALPEQVVNDVCVSAFQSAGQRCSAMRVLFVQEDVADKVLDMLAGAMDELVLGDPALLSTDVGPVIDDEAKSMLDGHIKRMMSEGRFIRRVKAGPRTEHGSFVAPAAFEIDRLSRLQREVFGPVLHVIRYPGNRLDQVIDAINDTGYGLTMGIHSRIDETVRYVCERTQIGNTYVNRNQIGAVVGVQPFGGEGLSGTGPKAGGPHYLPRFAKEVVEGGGAAAPMIDEPAGDLGEALSLSILEEAKKAHRAWAAIPADRRAAILEGAAGRIEREVGAEATEFLYSFAEQARLEMAEPEVMPGPTGERNELSLRPRGIFMCVASQGATRSASLGQVTAALASGNAVIAVGPATKGLATLRSALEEAGLPQGVLRICAALNGEIGALVADRRVGGVAVAGSIIEAKPIQTALGARDDRIVPLVLSGDGVTVPGGDPVPGGPHFLHRFVTERTLATDTTAAGGNASLLSIGEAVEGALTQARQLNGRR